MINLEERIVTQLLSTIYKDKKDPTVLRVNVDKVVSVLDSFGYNLPSNVFEKKLEEMLNAKLVGAKMSPGLTFSIAQMIVDIANKMHIKDEDIAAFLAKQNQEQDPREIQEKIIKWRKEYYGSLDKGEKQALIQSLENKLRPEVIDQIRRA